MSLIKIQSFPEGVLIHHAGRKEAVRNSMGGEMEKDTKEKEKKNTVGTQLLLN